MAETVDVTIPVSVAAAEALRADPGARARAGEMVSHHFAPDAAWAAEMARAMDDLAAGAEAAGLTPEVLEAELAAYNAERRSAD